MSTELGLSWEEIARVKRCSPFSTGVSAQSGPTEEPKKVMAWQDAFGGILRPPYSSPGEIEVAQGAHR
ncbi:hypothetical protein N7481_010650 [Penicillium waksmanii]|uniref:uncharacterized protein n=1 Tax=Penicillium waksmanii TaxID=69791 RepID=UPI002549BEDF|nr:uncharacterized protein N7481_010650 [Penicillium waksmanii]KAJ5973440.1 hypothetical protein N7481_010650 [Penicillium waksmanii]